jgi:hypothetical protein
MMVSIGAVPYHTESSSALQGLYEDVGTPLRFLTQKS